MFILKSKINQEFDFRSSNFTQTTLPNITRCFPARFTGHFAHLLKGVRYSSALDRWGVEKLHYERAGGKARRGKDDAERKTVFIGRNHDIFGVLFDVSNLKNKFGYIELRLTKAQ